MNIPDLIDGFISWQSTLPYRTNQETPFVDKQVFQNRGLCGQAFPFLPSPRPSRTFLRSPQFSRVQKAKSSSNLRKALRKRLLGRLPYIYPGISTTCGDLNRCPKIDEAWEEIKVRDQDM